MFSHVVVGSNDLDKSKAFYDAIFGTMGIEAVLFDKEAGRIAYSNGASGYMICTPIDGKAACHANGGTIGFEMADSDAVKKWHDAGVAAGGTSIEDAPGVRDGSFGKLYLAYLRDPDGNKLCGLHRMG
jgi:catechol 2,3-dioxygenase-like lactoylglutathione lyase family enzyme